MSIARVRVELRRNDEDGAFSLKRAFKRAVEQCRIIHECKERSHYEKPSEKRRRKRRQRMYQLELEKRESLGMSRTSRKRKKRRFDHD